MTEEHSVARRVAAGTASNAVGRAVVLVSRIAVMPIILHAVGATDFGIWVVIGAVAGFGVMLELGISAGLVKYVAEHSARGENEEAARIVGAATWLYGLLGAFFWVAGSLIALVAPGILGLEGEEASLVRVLGVLAAIDLGLSMVSIGPISVLKGLQRFPAVNVLTSAAALVSFGLTVAVLEAGTGIVGVSAVAAVNTALTGVASVVLARRIAPEQMATPLRRDGERLRRLLRFSRSIAAVQVAVNLQSRLDTIVIAAALPVRFVTPYTFGQRLADGTRIATDQFGRVLLPLASQVSATRDRATVRALFLGSMRLTMAIALAVGLPVALLGGPILEIWAGDQLAGYGTLVAILAAAAIVDLPSYPAAALMQSIERHGPIAWMAIGSAVANVALSIALVGPYGVEGVAAGTLIASAVEITVFVVPYAARVLEIGPREFVAEVVLRLLVPTVVIVGVVIGGHALLPVTSLLRLAIVAGGALTAFALAYAAFGAEPRERAAYRAGLAAVRRFASSRGPRRFRRAEGGS